MVEKKEKFAFNFDLFQDKIIQNGFDNPISAYKFIEIKLNKLGYDKRQQSSFISKSNTDIRSVHIDVKLLTNELSWLPSCVNHFTATAEDGVLDLKPYIREEMTKEEFIDLENTKHPEQDKEQRAIHFDLSMKVKI